MEIYRQGDVLVCRIKKIPAAAKPQPRDNGRVVLAYGEVTGHAHAFYMPNVTMYRDDGAGSGAPTRFIRVAGMSADLKHEEHSTITFPPGDYEIIQQHEYSPEEIRNVAD